MLVGRDREREVLDRLLDGAIRGRGGALVVHGEPGVGKTALLDYAINQGRQFRVARTVGVESDMELAFAALQQLCSPFLELMYCLPAPQRDALGVAFGLSAGRAPDPFLVGLAILGCSRRPPNSDRCSVSLMTHSGSIAHRHARWLSRRAGF
jgi:hypothetical protein